MARRSAISSRWLIVILVAALVCSALVVYALVQVTGRFSDAMTEPSADAAAVPPGAWSAASSAPVGQDGSSASPDVTDPTSDRGGRPAMTSGIPTSSPAAAPPLPGSGVTVPAAWSGTARLTITVNGDCADTGGTSTYSGLTAELALQAPVRGNDPFGDPNPFSMTLGVTPAAIPGLALYSAEVGDDGAVRRTWWLADGTDPAAADRTVISGSLISDRTIDGALPPNLLVDNETDLLPCQSGRPSGVSRTLGAGSSLSGWVSPTAAVIDVTGTTTDGERTIDLHAELERLPAGG